MDHQAHLVHLAPLGLGGECKVMVRQDGMIKMMMMKKKKKKMGKKIYPLTNILLCHHS